MARREPWDQRLLAGETDSEYAQFVWWRSRAPETRPPPSDRELAVRQQWAERALAWDNTQGLPEGIPERVHAAVELGTRIVWRELCKLEAQSAGSAEMIFGSPEKLARFAERVVGLPARAAGVPTEQHVHLPPDTDPAVIDAILGMRDFLLPQGKG
jgi:hypothetical protein